MVQTPATIDETLVQEIVRRILTVTKPDRIILFGSAATGEMTPDSDLDLLIVEPSPVDTRAERVALGRSLRGLGYPCDVFVMATVSFEESKTIIGGLAYPAHKNGKVIYEATG
jgi:predicted nucleotidyltransferase